MSILRPKFVTSTFSPKKKKYKKGEAKTFKIKEQKPDSEDNSDDPEEQKHLTVDKVESSGWKEEHEIFDNGSESKFDKWAGLSDLDRLNVLNSPLEDRARVLASKISTSVEDTMSEMGRLAKLDYLEKFELPENPTKIIPLRLIHGFTCLPLKQQTDGRINLITVWPPTNRMSRWIYAISGSKTSLEFGFS